VAQVSVPRLHAYLRDDKERAVQAQADHRLKRMRTKLSKVKVELIRRRDLPIPDQGRWLASVLRGHFNYYGVPDNGEAISAFRTRIIGLWLRALRRRSQRHRMTWARIGRLADRWLPPARILHPWPTVRFDAITQGRSPVR